jgi:hypothetical protein
MTGKSNPRLALTHNVEHSVLQDGLFNALMLERGDTETRLDA